MKTTKEKADRMIENHLIKEQVSISDATKHAILSVKHTIDYLKSISSNFIIDPNMKYAFDVIAFAIYEQEQLLKELESRV